MTVVYVLMPALVFGVGFMFAAPIIWPAETKHARCLKNIARLEHELGIAENPESPFEFKPGARWLVDDPRNFVQIIPAFDKQYQRDQLNQIS